MSVPRISRCSAILVLLLAGSVGAAVGQDDQSGAIPGFREAAGAARIVPPGLDDAFQPIEGLTEPGPELADVRDTRAESEATQVPAALWEQLVDLDPQQQANAVIELEFGRDAADADLETAAEIAALWNRGEYEPAIELLRSLENAGVQMGLGIAWIVPQQLGGRGGDVRIGDPRDGAQNMSLDFDAQNGNLFTVVRWGSTSGTAYWTMNISADGGVTWAETYSWFSSVGIIDVDGAVVDDYIYVGYVVGNTPAAGRMRRCLVSDGSVDAGYGFYTVIDAGANTIEDVALASNADDYDNRIYYAAIQSNDVLRWFWGVADDGTTFSEDSPATSNPESGLDMTWDHNHTCTEFIYVSYAGNDGVIHVQGKQEYVWTDWSVESGVSNYANTAISAYGDTIICAFEYQFPEGMGIRYRINYTCGGGSWPFANLAVPDGDAILACARPDVDARGGTGTACIYQEEAGEPDAVYYRTREGYASGPWDEPIQFNDFDVVTGTDLAMNHIPQIGPPTTFSHGAIYITDLADRIPYFDRLSEPSGPCTDTTPPVVEIDAPATLSCACNQVDITGSVDDPDGYYVGDQLEYRRRNVATWTVADTATGARSGILYVWDTTGLPQDFYYVRIVGENQCELTDSDSTFVYKSTTFGNLDLRAPVDGNVYAGTICVDGTAWTQSCFDHYTVDYRTAGVDPYSPVDPPASPYTSTVLYDPLASWNTLSGPSAVADGDYDVRLQGVTDCGDTTTEVNTIIVDNTSPDAEITDPAPCDYVTGLVNVYGTADDANLNSWSLQYTGDGVSGWVTISSGNAPVVNGLLGRWDTAALPHCAYTLRVVVTDTANVSCSGNTHRSEYLVSVNVGCPADIDGDGDVDLSDLAALLGVYGTTCP